MTLRIGQVGWARQAPSAAATAEAPPSRSVPEAGPRAVRLDPPVAGSFAPPGGSADETSLAAKVYPDLGATMRSLTSLSDLRAMMSALDAL